MFSDNRNSLIMLVCTVIISLIAVICACVLPRNEDPTVQVIYVTETPEMQKEENPTQRPIYVIRVTATPKTTNNIENNVTPTPVTTIEPVVTSTPIITSDPTVAPTPIITSEPTETPEPTNVPTINPNPVVTETPVQTSTPTPTQDVSKYYAKLESELKTLVMSGGIYPNYQMIPTYDLYESSIFGIVSIDIFNSEDLFNYLRWPFENGIANWINMEFDFSKSGGDRLSDALDSSVCNVCARVRVSDCPENMDKISTTFEEIRANDECYNANRIILDYLYNYTVKNPNNPSERLFLACNCE